MTAEFDPAKHPRAPDGKFKETHKPQRGRPDIDVRGHEDWPDEDWPCPPMSPRQRARGAYGMPLAPSSVLLRWEAPLRARFAQDPHAEQDLTGSLVQAVGDLAYADMDGEPPCWNSEWEKEALAALQQDIDSGNLSFDEHPPADKLNAVYDSRLPYASAMWAKARREASSRAEKALNADSRDILEDALLDASQRAYSAYVGCDVNDPEYAEHMGEFSHRFRVMLSRWLTSIENDRDLRRLDPDTRDVAMADEFWHPVRSHELYATKLSEHDPARNPRRSQTMAGGHLKNFWWEDDEAHRSHYYEHLPRDPDREDWELYDRYTPTSMREADALIDFASEAHTTLPKHLDEDVKGLLQTLEDNQEADSDQPVGLRMVERSDGAGTTVWYRPGTSAGDAAEAVLRDAPKEFHTGVKE